MPVSSGEQEPVAFRKPSSIKLLDLSISEIDAQRRTRSRTGWLRDTVAEHLNEPTVVGILGTSVTPEVIDTLGLALTELFSNADGEAPQSRSKRQRRRVTRASVGASQGNIRVEIGDNEPAVSDDGRAQTVILSVDTRALSASKKDKLLSALQDHGLGRAMLSALGVELGEIPLDETQADGTRKLMYADIPVPPGITAR